MISRAKKTKRMKGGGITSSGGTTSRTTGPGGGMMGGSGSGGSSRTAASKPSNASSPKSSSRVSSGSTVTSKTSSGNKSGVGGGGGGGGGSSGSRGSSVGAPVGGRSGSQAKGNVPAGNKSFVGGGGGGGGGSTGSRGSSTVKPAPVQTGNRFGPMSPDIQDMRKWQGPPDRQTAAKKRMVERRQKMSEMWRLKDQQDLSTFAGHRSPTGANYGPTRIQKGRELDAMRQSQVDRKSLRDKNADRRRTNAGADTFRQEVSGMLPAAKLPSHRDRTTSGPSNRISVGSRNTSDTLFRKGGLVKKKNPKNGK
jgi:hypothetical protein